MIKTLWFMVKIALFVAAALWVAQQPGRVEVEWLNYTVTIHVGLFLVALLGLILTSIFIYTTIKTFVDLPKSVKRYNEIKRFEKGYKALTLGLSAVAAGDGKIATYQAHRAEELLEGDTGLPMLLKAQAARMSGDEESAEQAFAALLGNEDAAFLGVRGLLQSALDTHDYSDALGKAYKALEMQPKQPWVLKTIYDLEIQLRDWDKALAIQKRVKRSGALSAEDARRDHAAMLHVQAGALADEGLGAEAQKKVQAAYDVDKSFVPSVVMLARGYHASGQRRKALRLVEKAWRDAPHADLALAWEVLISKSMAAKPLGRMQWAERLVKLSLNAYESQIFAGRVAAEEKLWGEARKYFERAQALDFDARLYTLWAAMEEQAGASEAVVTRLLEKADEAPLALVWSCAKTGQVYAQWQALNAQGQFNTLRWGAVNDGDGVDVIGRFMPAGGVLDAPVG